MIEWMTGNVYSLQVTLYNSNITLNSAATSYFNDCRWVMIGLNKETKLLAIRPITKREVDLKLVPLEQLHKISIGKGYGRISNKNIMKDISQMINQEITQIKVSATFDEKEKMLMVDLNHII